MKTFNKSANIRKLATTVIFLSLITIHSLADTPPDPGGGPDPGGNPVGGGAPIDPGFLIYLVIASIYLGYKLFVFYKKHIME